EAQRRRSASLACRRARPNRRSQDHRAGRAAAVELAAYTLCRARRLKMAAPGHAITVHRAAELLGEDDELLWDMATEMESEHRLPLDLRHRRPADHRIALTPVGMEYLREMLPESKRNWSSPRS